tara:strand:- start:1254 stop:1883 length:630 start_codon:yes stop_codon:yes gene_type:complete
MLIPFDQLVHVLSLKIKGILHVGAHECEELADYLRYGLSMDQIFWVEAMKEKVDMIKEKFNNQIRIYEAVIDEKDGAETPFYITNNGQSSSILEFGSHAQHHPQVSVVSEKKLTTTRLDTLIEANYIPIENINFLNFDIQGVELRALKSMEKYLKHIDYIYTEVNSEQVYKHCDLIGDIDSYLESFGFKRVAVRMAGNCGWGDAFYMRS